MIRYNIICPRDEEEEFWKDHVMMDNTDLHKHIHLHYQHSYTCENQGDYNAMSMLWLNGGVKGVKVLLQRGFPHMLSWQVRCRSYCSPHTARAAVVTVMSASARMPQRRTQRF